MEYTSQRKRLADKTMTKATRRFKSDTGRKYGDWGKANTKYAPGPTYDHELRPGDSIEEAEKSFQLIDTPKRPHYDHDAEASRVDYENPNTGKKSTIGDWLHRQGLEKDETNHYIFYHGTPKKNKFTHLAPHSKLAHTAKDAAHFAARDRGLKPHQIKVYKVRMRPSEVDGSVWANTRSHVHHPLHEEDMKEKLLQGVIAEAKEKEKCPHCGSSDTYSKPSAPLTSKCFDCKKEWPFKFLTLNVPKKAVKEAELPVTDCAVCGGKHHPGAKHLARALAPENNLDEAFTLSRVGKPKGKYAVAHNPSTKQWHVMGVTGTKNGRTHYNSIAGGFKSSEDAHTHAKGLKEAADVPKKKKGASGEPINQKGSWWKQLKKKWQMEGEEAPKCDDCGKDHAPDVPCPKKKLLFGDEHCEHCGESYPEGDPHHCWQSGHHNEVKEAEWATPEIRRPTVSPTELAMRAMYPSRPAEKHCQCGHPESFHDKGGCKTCHVSGDYTEKLGARHTFSQRQWESEDLFAEGEAGKKICWCGHSGHKHNKNGCKECRQEKVMKPEHAAHQFSARGAIKEDEITEGKDKEKQAKKKLALFNKSSAARQSRAAIGPIPAQRVIVPKKDRKPKHKPNFMDESEPSPEAIKKHTDDTIWKLKGKLAATKHPKEADDLAARIKAMVISQRMAERPMK